MFRLVKLSINGRPLWVELKSETEHLSRLLRSWATSSDRKPIATRASVQLARSWSKTALSGAAR
jgi:hypothetical protein